MTRTAFLSFALLVFALLTVPAARAEVPADLLARAKEASGGAAWDAVRTITTTAKIETGGLSGVVTSWDEVTTGRYASEWQIGPVQGGDGFDGAVGWTVEASGQVIRSEKGESHQSAMQRAYLTALAYWYPERRKGSVESLGMRTENGRSFAGIKATAEGGRPMELWFDGETHLLDHTIDRVDAETQLTIYSDYREVQGLKVPFVVRITNGEEKYDTRITAESIVINQEVEAARFAPPAEKTGDLELSDGRTTASVPFRLANNHIFVQVEINGQGKFNLFFDTGGLNAITPEAAQALGLSTEGALQGSGVGEKSEDIAVVRIASVKLGGVQFRDQLFYVFPLAEMSKVEGLPISGMVGYELLKRLVAEVDYDGGMINFTAPADFVPPKDAIAIPFTFESETPQIEGKIDGLPGLFTIDTGSRSTLDLNAPFVAEHGLLAKHPKAIEATTGWGVGGAAKSRVTRLNKLELGTGPAGTGSVAIENLVTGFSLQKKGAMAKSSLAGNIGGGLLKRFDVTFDYRKQVMYLKPNGNERNRDAYDRAGMWLLTDPEGLRVKDVTAGGPAAKAGLKVEDLILTVDGKKAAEVSLPDLRIRLANDPEGTKVELAVRGKDGKERAVGVVLRELV
ncbi:MAG TPA: aspartyl protease family protein [Thermoanaerobaculia bacterium]|jgi:hypothetical protein|nr:aspartyl protease family protein [Thermoanaerobaculia bacterium]